MFLWRRLLLRLGLRSGPASRTYELDEALSMALEDLALRERRPAGEVAAEMVASGLRQRLSEQDVAYSWQSLSPREQDVTALACLGYTNQQMAVRLGISAETVKTHLHNALVKFGLHERSGLRLRLARWDFSAWDPPSQPPPTG